MRNVRDYNPGKRWIGALVTVMVAGVFLVACGESSPQEKAVEKREDVLTQAERVAPVPNTVNFPIRKALVAFTERQDLVNHPWYIYIMGMNGQYVGYFVGQTYPVNACNFLSSSEKVTGPRDNKVVIAAPSLDGVYYGGSGSSPACNSYFFFDVETNAMQTFVAPMWFASDAPLDLDIPRINNNDATPTP